jgi:small subunit ribosomal protein S21
MEQVETQPDVETRREAQPEARPERRDRDFDRRGDRDNRPESFEQMLRRFKKSVDNAGILKEVRARSFFESKSQKARRKAAKAARRRTRNKNRSAES